MEKGPQTLPRRQEGVPVEERIGCWAQQIGGGEVITDKEFFLPREDEFDDSISKRFQWLPSDVAVDDLGNARFCSYVNNVHPDDHGGLMDALEGLLTRFIPLFNRVLTHMMSPWPNLIEVVGRERAQPTVPIVYSPPKPFEKQVDLRGRRLQVITKLANIVLTPERPSYDGGSWHVEGCQNEAIVATGIYYYEADNITESQLQFRQAIEMPRVYYTDDEDELMLGLYGLHDEAELNEHLGHCLCLEDRCLCFPNVFQHRVSPFELADKTKPGSRKIAVFFLVDPSVRVLSTKRVPLQRQDWVVRELCKALPLEGELVAMIATYLDSSLSMERAKEIRAELMKERKRFSDLIDSALYEPLFNMCEH